MSKLNVSKLSGAALDWVVANCQGLPIKHDPMGFKTGSEAGFWVWDDDPKSKMGRPWLIGREYSPCTKWDQGGPIIEEKNITLLPAYPHDFGWIAATHKDKEGCFGGTPLVAAMRCYVESVLGSEIEVPESLCG